MPNPLIPRPAGNRPRAGGKETLGRLGGLSASEGERGERALWLSGAGFRAALFHLGALTRLNELGLLARLGTIGGVSGGSILAALLATRIPWPLYGAYRDWPEQVAEPMRAIASRNARARVILRQPFPQAGGGNAALEERYARELISSLGGESNWGPRVVFGASGLTLSGLAAGWEEGLEWELGGVTQPPGYGPSLVAGTIAAVRTDLDAFSAAEQAVLENHGYLLADAALRAHGLTSAGGIAAAPPEPPHPGWTNGERVREALAASGRRTLVGRLRPRRGAQPERSTEPSSERLAAVLERHRPVLQYDSLESCRADAAAAICSFAAPGRCNSLHRADGTLIAAVTPKAEEAKLELAFLRGERYPNGERVDTGDYLDECGGSHSADAIAIRRWRPEYADVAYGRARHDREGALWLQYWFFYYFQDKGLLGLERREGDWEMVQMRLGAGGVPEVATFVQHGGAERLRWDQVELALTDDGQVPVIYPARGSHAARPRPGSYRAPFVPDHNDGLGPRVRPRLCAIADDGPDWVHWPGRWGSTRRREHFEADSPRGPSQHPQWWEPAELHDEAAPWTGPSLIESAVGPPRLRLRAHLEGNLAVVSYSFGTPSEEAEKPARIVAAPYDKDGEVGRSHAFPVEAGSGELALQLSGAQSWKGVRAAVTSDQGLAGETVAVSFG
ncbi:MAG: hypothetical protein QOE56_1326 [Solirubrobacterales bacterium]|jgi:hypothetical protein|nr:hypothetical protein [Solirubrobacterales bacterium]